jgi:predicted esterase YcpF (UPF0227 family)
MDWTIEKFIGARDIIIPMSSYNQDWEWFRTIRFLHKNYSFSKMWIKDPYAAYWQIFNRTTGAGPHELASFIKSKIKQSGAKRSLMLGLSMGGYGAILFGCLCQVDLVIAISPQTDILDYRIAKYKLNEKWKDFNVNREEIDLKRVLQKYDTGKTIYKIFYADHNHHDSTYAERMSVFPNVKLFPINSRHHTVARLIMQQKILQKHLKAFLQKKIKV